MKQYCVRSRGVGYPFLTATRQWSLQLKDAVRFNSLGDAYDFAWNLSCS